MKRLAVSAALIAATLAGCGSSADTVSTNFTSEATEEFLRVRALVDDAINSAAGLGETLVPA